LIATAEKISMQILVGMPEPGAQGGPAACEPPFVAELRRLGHEVQEEVYAYAKANVGLASRAQRVLNTASRFKQRLRSGKFDLVHLNTAFDLKALLRDAVIVPRLSREGAKVFLKFHGSDARLLATKNPALAALRRRLLMHADGIGVLSSGERDNFLRAGVAEEKIFLVKNVVEEKLHQPDTQFRRHWSLPEDRPLLLFIGRFIPAKGLLDVIRACALLRDAGHKFLLLCVGDGPARPEAESTVAELALQDQVRFFGYLPEEQTAAFYANATALVFPTYHEEGLPMVIFNAAAVGLPILTTRIRGAADYLREPENCLWVEPRRPDLLAARILEVLANPELRATMNLNNGQLAANFSPAVVAQDYLKVYDSLVRYQT
jgi:glycosyltransferase involved in cell wall biosynthesis